MKPIYNDLSKESLLERCVGGFTQNNNESLNQLIWKISLKIMSGGVINGLFQVGGKNYSKTTEPISLKFCRLF